MTDVAVPPALQQDPARFVGRGRDPQRTPMRWDAISNAGFTTGRPWLPIGDDVEGVNVAAQRTDRRSMLELHRRLIELRRAEPALTRGSWTPVEAEGDVLAYERSLPGRRLVIALNLGARSRSPALDATGDNRLLLTTHLDRDGDAIRQLDLRPNEGVILATDPTDRPLQAGGPMSSGHD
jgi:alpha-glucosidase